MQFEDCVEIERTCFCKPIKGQKAKPQRRDNLQNHFVYSRHRSDEEWKSIMAEGGQEKISSGAVLYLRALQGHSGRNFIDPSLQNNVVVLDDFFKYIYHVGCAINLHSIINSGLILGGENLSKRQTVFFLPLNLMDIEHKDPEKIDLEAPRLARYMQSMEETSKHGVFGSTSNLLKRKDKSSIRRDRTPSFITIHSQPVAPRKPSGWKLEKPNTKKFLNHLDLLRRFP